MSCGSICESSSKEACVYLLCFLHRPLLSSGWDVDVMPGPAFGCIWSCRHFYVGNGTWLPKDPFLEPPASGTLHEEK